MLPIFFGCLIPISIGIYTDYKKGMLYDVLTLPILIFGLGYAYYKGSFTEALIGAGVMFVLYLALGMFGGVGGGDIKLAAGVGAWFGLMGSIPVMLFASMLAIVMGLYKLYKLGVLRTKLVIWCRGICILFNSGIGTIELNQLPAEGETIPPEAVPFGIPMGIAVWVWALYIYHPWSLLGATF
jgi:Flp pilus assembly protein protease CpaA